MEIGRGRGILSIKLIVPYSKDFSLFLNVYGMQSLRPRAL